MDQDRLVQIIKNASSTVPFEAHRLQNVRLSGQDYKAILMAASRSSVLRRDRIVRSLVIERPKMADRATLVRIALTTRNLKTRNALLKGFHEAQAEQDFIAALSVLPSDTIARALKAYFATGETVQPIREWVLKAGELFGKQAGDRKMASLALTQSQKDLTKLIRSNGKNMPEAVRAVVDGVFASSRGFFDGLKSIGKWVEHVNDLILKQGKSVGEVIDEAIKSNAPNSIKNVVRALVRTPGVKVGDILQNTWDKAADSFETCIIALRQEKKNLGSWWPQGWI